jgi:hypothetical protein
MGVLRAAAGLAARFSRFAQLRFPCCILRLLRRTKEGMYYQHVNGDDEHHRRESNVSTDHVVLSWLNVHVSPLERPTGFLERVVRLGEADFAAFGESFADFATGGMIASALRI